MRFYHQVSIQNIYTRTYRPAYTVSYSDTYQVKNSKGFPYYDFLFNGNLCVATVYWYPAY